jgi:peptidoglycan/xylan/chitin deacetylase (PgdA/CDA1 family)
MGIRLNYFLPGIKVIKIPFQELCKMPLLVGKSNPVSKLIQILIISVLFSGCSTNKTESIFGETEITNWQNNKSGAISITYDDASINQFRQAMPIMDSLSLKGTFFINTADIPGSAYPPKYLGRPLKTVISESKTPTTLENLFERCSALRFLDIENAIQSHNSAGSLYENKKYDEAFKIVDEAFATARKKGSPAEIRPVLLTGDLITWPEIKKYAANGHEFGNHTISHPRLAVLDEANLLYELEKCKEEIKLQLGSAHTFSAECPFGTENERVMEYAYKIHPALRNRMPEPFLEEINRWNPAAPTLSKKDYVQWQRGPLKKTTVNEMKSYVDTLLSDNNIWLVLTFHGVDGVGWEAKPHQELKEYFSYMKTHEDSLWVGTFGDVTKYIREKMNSKIAIQKNDDGVSITLTHGLDSVYNYPLTLKTYVDDVDELIIKQGSTSIPYTRHNDQKGNYLLYKAVPNRDDIKIARE